jgi:4Fe-4S ferredoxin
MPMKLLKIENEDELTVERILHAKRHSLTLEKNRCTACEICMIICPKEAIEVKKVPKKDGEKAKRPVVDVDENKCHFCGICSSICPFGALEVKVDGETAIPVVKSESFPQLIREIKVDTAKCNLDCVDIEDPCPLGLIDVRVQPPDGKEVKNAEARAADETLEVVVDIEKDYCPCCRVCEVKFPDGAIRVRKIFNGIITINREKCPEGCHDCLDICPITGALYLSEDGKVHVNELHCVYCGACRIVCPEEGALELERTYIHHTPVRSGAWNKALEKLTSAKEMTKELRTKSSTRLRESVGRRLLPGGGKDA